MLERIYNGSFLLRSTVWLPGIFRLRKIIILSLNYTTLAFNLGNVQVIDMQSVLFLDIGLDLFISGFSALIAELFIRPGKLQMVVDIFPT